MKTTILSALRACLAAAFLLPLALTAGCEGDHHDGDGGGDGAGNGGGEAVAGIVGTWKLTADDGSSWYVHFNADGSWKITDDEADEALRVYGTYSTDGSSFSGSMKNPHVGEGEITGSVDGNSMSLDFIEHWHTPYKHVAYTGEKL